MLVLALVLLLVLIGTDTAEVVPVLAEVVELTPAALCGGIWTTRPVTSSWSVDSPFAAASCATLNPSCAAIELSDSPGMIVCWKKAEAEAGAIIVAAATSGIKNLALMAGDCRREPRLARHLQATFQHARFSSFVPTARIRRRRGRLGQELAQAASELPGNIRRPSSSVNGSASSRTRFSTAARRSADIGSRAPLTICERSTVSDQYSSKLS